MRHCNAFRYLMKNLLRILNVFFKIVFFKDVIECFHSRGQHICKFIGTKERVCIRKEFNSQRTGLGHQHGRRFIVLGHQYGRRDVMWKHSIMSNTRQTIAGKTYSATGRVSLHVWYLMKHHYSCLFCWLFVLHQKVFLFSYFVKVKTGKALDKHATMEDKSPE